MVYPTPKRPAIGCCASRLDSKVIASLRRNDLLRSGVSICRARSSAQNALDLVRMALADLGEHPPGDITSGRYPVGARPCSQRLVPTTPQHGWCGPSAPKRSSEWRRSPARLVGSNAPAAATRGSRTHTELGPPRAPTVRVRRNWTSEESRESDGLRCCSSCKTELV